MKKIIAIILGISMAAITTMAAISHEDESIVPKSSQMGNIDNFNGSEAFDFDSELGCGNK